MFYDSLKGDGKIAYPITSPRTFRYRGPDREQSGRSGQSRKLVTSQESCNITTVARSQQEGESPLKSRDEKVQEIRALQAELDHRSETEGQASRLIVECRFKEAMELLNTLGGSGKERED